VEALPDYGVVQVLRLWAELAVQARRQPVMQGKAKAVEPVLLRPHPPAGSEHEAVRGSPEERLRMKFQRCLHARLEWCGYHRN
jgi:hypothetical protein